ncbi:hypothetical protein FB45DRAFT_696597, partial [Roridomyces roridus]
DKCACRICGKPLRADSRQNHVGEHLLQHMLGVPHSQMTVSIAPLFPCGFCGGPSCSISIDHGRARSNCPLAYPFVVKTAANSSTSKPSTNVPIACPYTHCEQTHWKYNFHQHLDNHHPNWRSTLPPAAPLFSLISVSEDEQSKLRVPE